MHFMTVGIDVVKSVFQLREGTRCSARNRSQKCYSVSMEESL